MSTSVELLSYPATKWDTDEGGRCATCGDPCKKYGSGGNPLCRACFAAAAAAWGPGIRQKGYNA